MKKSIWLVLLLSAFLVGCTPNDSEEEEKVTDTMTILSADEDYQKQNSSGVRIVDNHLLYETDSFEKFDTVYLAVASGNKADGTDYTWSELNGKSLRQQGSNPYRCEAVIQFGDDIGPLEGQLGYGVRTANATVRLHGTDSSEKAQKGYRIDLKDGKGNVGGIRQFNLVKSVADPYRFTNTLCYSLLENIPGQFSTRQKLVHLYVKDTSLGQTTPYVDYGMYTIVEPVNKTYLKNRGLDSSGDLYKAVNFDFTRHEEEIQTATSTGYSKSKFETVLEIDGNEDHTKLVTMLTAVNNTSVPIAEVISTYFDEENLFNYLAFQILMENYDAATENYYLYSPTGTEKFYFIPWDMDGALRKPLDRLQDETWEDGWKTGVFPMCQNQLFNRIYNDLETRALLDDAVEEVYRKYISEGEVRKLVHDASSVLEEPLYQLPDSMFARVTKTQYKTLINGIADEINKNYTDYFDCAVTPQPFHINAPEKGEDGIHLSWETALCDTDVTYQVKLAHTWTFENCITVHSGVQKNELIIPALPKGQYFVSVIAMTSDGATQIAYENYPTEFKNIVRGTLCFYVDEAGDAIASYFDLEY